MTIKGNNKGDLALKNRIKTGTGSVAVRMHLVRVGHGVEIWGLALGCKRSELRE